MTRCDVVIIGAGPYGLSVAAHLGAIKGLEVCVFGEPMSFWERNMPKGMLLRSNWSATQIADPHRALTLEAFQEFSGHRFSTPVPLGSFIDYGRWYQRQAVPGLIQQKVVRVESDPKGFRLTREDGQTIGSRRVVIATGIGSFAWIPQQFRELPSSLLSHASEHTDLRKFAGKVVLVVGTGQSALESGALLHEGGADVAIVGRARRIHWLQGRLSRALHHHSGTVVRRLLYAPTDVGPAGISQLMARPHLLKHLPRSLQDLLRKRSVRPAGARWLVERLRHVPIKLDCRIASVTAAGDKLRVTLTNGDERMVDHLLLGTGYRVDVSKYGFLDPKIVSSIHQFNGYPHVGAGLETSVPGLHIVGAPAVRSFGPLMQFVSGTGFASQTLTRHIAGQSWKPLSKPVFA